MSSWVIRVRRATVRLLPCSSPALHTLQGLAASPFLHSPSALKWLCLVMTKSLRFSAGLFHHVVKFTACWRAPFYMKNEHRNTGSTLPRGDAHNRQRQLQLRFATDDGQIPPQFPSISITAVVVPSTWFITSLTVFCITSQNKISPSFYLKTTPSPSPSPITSTLRALIKVIWALIN